jgi:hypothetical protein
LIGVVATTSSAALALVSMANLMLRMMSAMNTMAYALDLSSIWHVYKPEACALFLVWYVAVCTVLDVSASVGFAGLVPQREMLGTI